MLLNGDEVSIGQSNFRFETAAIPVAMEEQPAAEPVGLDLDPAPGEVA